MGIGAWTAVQLARPFTSDFMGAPDGVKYCDGTIISSTISPNVLSIMHPMDQVYVLAGLRSVGDCEI